MLKTLTQKLKDFKLKSLFLKMSESLTPKSDPLEGAQKRQAPDDPVSAPSKKKKKKRQQGLLSATEGGKRKIALLVSYNGTGYYGVQINRGFATIEGELFPALVKIGAVLPECVECPQKMWFQRGSRTDKGVSAVGQTFSLKAEIVPDFVQKLNETLPEKIKVQGYIRVTKGFDAKNWCAGRTYTYMMPTFSFAPIEKFITDEYRVEPETIEKVRGVLKRFIGTHKFHNFTSGVKHNEMRAARYIREFECSDPYIRDDMEFVTLQVKGQSFMLHHIRKMIGLTIAIVRGYCGEETIDKSWGPEQVDIPKAPGLGLVLEELHFDGYNKKFGRDGIHEPIDWAPFRDSMAKFKDEYILNEIVAQEKADRSMFNWMRTLQFHNFGESRGEGPEMPWVKLKENLEKFEDQEKTEESLVKDSSQESKDDCVAEQNSEPIKTETESTVHVEEKIVAECGSEENIVPKSDTSESDKQNEAVSR